MTDIQLEQVLPGDIERRSFELIQEELSLQGIHLKPENEMVIKRAIHTTADFDYAQNLVFSGQAVKRGTEALKAGAVIVTDTNMGLSGEAFCFMADEDVALQAKEQGTTRAVASMEKAARLYGLQGRPLIFAVGNAPTALVRIYELIEEGLAAPALVIGVPVGFVNVVQSKELILTLEDTPYIVAGGRKGGSNVAAAICNALLYQIPVQGVAEST